MNWWQTTLIALYLVWGIALYGAGVSIIKNHGKKVTAKVHFIFFLSIFFWLPYGLYAKIRDAAKKLVMDKL